MATRYNINDFALANPAYVGGTVSFWTVSGGAKTATLATLYAASTGSTTLANPRTLDSDGKFSVPVYVEVPVIATVSGLTVADHDTGIMGLAESAAATSAAAALASQSAASVSAAAALASQVAAAASAASIDLAADTHAATSKATPVDADELPLADSAASFGLKKLTWANLKATLKTYFDSLYLTLAGGNLTGGINGKLTTVASHATTADIFATTVGNLIDWTGTETTTIFPNAPQAGAERTLVCAGAAVFTAGANMLIDGVSSGSNFTAAAGDKIIVRAVTTTQFRLTPQKYDGTAVSGIRLATERASTSGTSIDFTSIPSWVKRVTVMLNRVSLSGTSTLRIRIGTGGVPATSGYDGYGFNTAGSPATQASTTGFDFYGGLTAAHAASGTFVLTKSNTLSWTINGIATITLPTIIGLTGNVTLAGALDIVRITTVNGTDTFDAGTINILYE